MHYSVVHCRKRRNYWRLWHFLVYRRPVRRNPCAAGFAAAQNIEAIVTPPAFAVAKLRHRGTNRLETRRNRLRGPETLSNEIRYLSGPESRERLVISTIRGV